MKSCKIHYSQKDNPNPIPCPDWHKKNPRSSPDFKQHLEAIPAIQRAISKNLNGCVYFLFIGIAHTHNTFHHCVGTVEQWVPSQRIGKHAENSDGTRPNKILQPKKAKITHSGFDTTKTFLRTVHTSSSGRTIQVVAHIPMSSDYTAVHTAPA